MKRGDIYIVALDPAQGREQRGHRPVDVLPQTILDDVLARLATIFAP